MKNTEERKSKALIILATLILTVIFTSSAASAANLNVDPEAEEGYTTIQAAVDAANAEDTIFVSQGTYVENLKIDKEVRIWSDSRNPEDTIVKPADPAESTVEITADRVTFSGFGVEDSEKAGILLTGADSCYINNNRVQNSEYGVLLQDAKSNDINGNTITLNEVGVRLENSTSNTIQKNIIAYNYGPGISLEESSKNIIYNNYIKNAENVEENAVNANNSWQSTLTTKSNIIRGPYIGGNYWADLEGTGFSETSVDENSNGICDSPYTLPGEGVDKSPLYPKVQSAVTSIESELDANAYEEGIAAGEEAVNETETSVEEQTEETEPAAEGNETNETEEKESPAPGLVFTFIAAGAAYLLRQER